VTINELKAHLRLLSDVDNVLLASVIEAATAMIEERLERQLVSAPWRLEIDDFPDGEEIVLPRPPFQLLESVEWQDSAGAWHEVDAIAVVSNGVCRVLPAVGERWPAGGVYGVRVDFVAGYGDEAADVPAPVRHAILMTAASLYEQTDAQTDKPLTDNPTVDRLLAPYRIGDHT
jgi:uncharacterized phiE125 gp8 family phage protein